MGQKFRYGLAGDLFRVSPDGNQDVGWNCDSHLRFRSSSKHWMWAEFISLKQDD